MRGKKLSLRLFNLFIAIFLFSVFTISGCEFEDELMDGMNIYFGNLHSHTGVSDGKGSPEEVFAWARDVAKLDFYAVTDHSELIMSWEWKDTGEQADNFNQDGTFVAMRGFEWSHAIAGNICVYNTWTYTNSILTFTLGMFYNWLDGKNGLAQFNHPGREIGVFRNLGFDSDTADNVFAIETGNKGDGNNDGEYLPYYIKALDKGWNVAPTSNQDNHSLTINSHRTAVIAGELSREGLLEAMESRRIYSTDDPDMLVVFKCGDVWMGSSIELPGEDVEFIIGVKDNEKIEKVELITTGGETIAEYICTDETALLWRPVVKATSGSYFFVKVTGFNELDDDSEKQIAVTAPIRIK